MTLSGGECLLQPEFCRAVCVMAHRLGVTAAIDTAAAGVETQWRRLLPEVDDRARVRQERRPGRRASPRRTTKGRTGS